MHRYLLLLPLILAQALAVSRTAVDDKCPPKSAQFPCRCKTNYDGACIVSCILTTAEDIERVIQIPNLCNGHVHFVLYQSILDGIPAKLWNLLFSSKTVDVSIQHSTLHRLLLPGEAVGESHSPGSAVLKIGHSRIQEWDWQTLKGINASEGFTLVVDNTMLPKLTPDFADVAGGAVRKVSIGGAQLASLPERVFATFDKLHAVTLQNNNLTSIERSLFPNPAARLEFLNLNGNFLTSVPGDLFTNMPALRVVYLRNNQMKTLPGDLFRGVTSTQLKMVDLLHNEWECDCALMRVIPRDERMRVNMGRCAGPIAVKEQRVQDAARLLIC